MSYIFKSEDAFGLARAIGIETHEHGDELFFKFCPKCKGGDHHDKDTFSINLKTGLFKCFRAGCDYRGHFVELARDFDYDLGFGEKRVYRKLPQKPVVVRDGAVEYMASRGISAEVCKRYELTTRTDNKNILVFPFYDESGTLQFVKYRNMKFRKGIDKNKEWSEADAMPILFGMKQCVGFDRLIITEGQIDSLTVAECGLDNAVSVPTGANGFTWLANCWDWITRFKEIVVFGDNEHGKITLADTLKARLTQVIKVVRRKDYLGEKDANDILRKYGKEAVKTAVNNAEVPRLENVKDLSTVESIDLNSLQKIKTNIPEIDRVIGGLVMSQVVLLTGKRGEGKSTFMSQLVCEALDQGENVFVYSGELADYHFKRWLDYQLAGTGNIQSHLNPYGDYEYSIAKSVLDQISNWYKGRAYIYDNSWVPDDGEEMETLPETIEKVIRQYSVRLVCIDNLMTAMETVPIILSSIWLRAISLESSNGSRQSTTWSSFWWHTQGKARTISATTMFLDRQTLPTRLTWLCLINDQILQIAIASCRLPKIVCLGNMPLRMTLSGLCTAKSPSGYFPVTATDIMDGKKISPKQTKMPG